MQGYYYLILLLSLLLTLSVFPYVIAFLRRYKIGQYIQDDGPKHADKSQTPTCAGVAVVFLLNVLLFICGAFRSWALLIVDLVFIGFMSVGLIDDVAKLLYRDNNKGLTPRMKMLLQACLSVITLVAIHALKLPELTQLHFPLGGGTYWIIDLGWVYYPFAVFAILGSTNAYNLTDGLDGLAGGLSVLIACGLLVLLSLGQTASLPAVVQEDLMTLLVILIGVVLGFMCFNSYPASIFLGDSGSLSLGAGFVCIAIITKSEIIFALMSGVFIIETLSVIAQVIYFKRSGGKRLFKMAPLHHHYELSGYKEPKIVFSFWILGLIFLLMSICLLV